MRQWFLRSGCEIVQEEPENWPAKERKQLMSSYTPLQMITDIKGAEPIHWQKLGEWTGEYRELYRKYSYGFRGDDGPETCIVVTREHDPEFNEVYFLAGSRSGKNID